MISSSNSRFLHLFKDYSIHCTLALVTAVNFVYSLKATRIVEDQYII